MRQAAIKNLTGFDELPFLTAISLMNASSPSIPFGYSVTSSLRSETSAGISQQDAKQSVLLGLILGLSPPDTLYGVWMNPNSKEDDEDKPWVILQPSQSPALDQANTVLEGAQDDVAVTFTVTQNSG